MEATIVIIAIAIVLIGVVAVIVARRRSEARAEEARCRATEARDLAEVAASTPRSRPPKPTNGRPGRPGADRPEQQRLEAERRRREAADLHAEADEIDPDVDTRTDATVDEPAHAEFDLREQDVARTCSIDLIPVDALGRHWPIQPGIGHAPSVGDGRLVPLFDFDGTLVDSDVALTSPWHALGVDPPRPAGLPLVEACGGPA